MLIYCRAPLSPDSQLFDKYRGKKASDYDTPGATSVRDDQVYPCCGLFELETWNVCLRVVWTLCDLLGSNCLNLKQLLWHLPQELYFYGRFCLAS